MLLLDSNIVIYMLHGDRSIDNYIVSLGSPPLAISAVSRTEVLLGLDKEQMSVSGLKTYLDLFDCLPITKEVADCAAELYYSHKYPLKFKDLLIAATAIVYKAVLLTADKDFKRVAGLEVLLMERK